MSDSRPAEVKIGIVVYADGCNSPRVSDPDLKMEVEVKEVNKEGELSD